MRSWDPGVPRLRRGSSPRLFPIRGASNCLSIELGHLSAGGAACKPGGALAGANGARSPDHRRRPPHVVFSPNDFLILKYCSRLPARHERRVVATWMLRASRAVRKAGGPEYTQRRGDDAMQKHILRGLLKVSCRVKSTRASTFKFPKNCRRSRRTALEGAKGGDLVASILHLYMLPI